MMMTLSKGFTKLLKKKFHLLIYDLTFMKLGKIRQVNFLDWKNIYLEVLLESFLLDYFLILLEAA